MRLEYGLSQSKRRDEVTVGTVIGAFQVANFDRAEWRDNDTFAKEGGTSEAIAYIQRTKLLQLHGDEAIDGGVGSEGRMHLPVEIGDVKCL